MIPRHSCWEKDGSGQGADQEKKSTQYFCTTCSNNYGQIYNVGQLGGTWNARDREGRAEQRWRPLGRARAPSSTVHACFPYPAAAPLPRYLPWAIFRTMSCLEISVSKLMFLTLDYPQTRCLCLWVVVMWGCGVFDSTLSCFGFLLEIKAKLWLCSVVLAGGQSLL